MPRVGLRQALINEQGVELLTCTSFRKEAAGRSRPSRCE
jgi:hypothetical protein